MARELVADPASPTQERDAEPHRLDSHVEHENASDTAVSHATHPAIYTANVMHQRLFPVRYRFVYPVFYLLLDVDQIQTSFWLRHNKRGLLSFYDSDHGSRGQQSLRAWAEQTLQQRNIDIAGGKIYLLSMPRIAGYVFNPLSLWYCYHQDGSLRAIIAEVSNTFGEKHSYLLHDDAVMDLQKVYQANKCFHVSPFIGMAADYHFRFTAPHQQLRISINEYSPDDTGTSRLMLLATLDGQRLALTERNLRRMLWRFPFVTLKVLFLIHWQALQIWWRGARYYSRPQPPEHEVT